MLCAGEVLERLKRNDWAAESRAGRVIDEVEGCFRMFLPCGNSPSTVCLCLHAEQTGSGILCSGEAAYLKLPGDEIVPATAKQPMPSVSVRKRPDPPKTPLPVAPVNRPVPPVIV